MNDFKFISYIPTPNDEYGMLGIAKVLAYGKIELRYKHVKTKDGNGSFFCPANYSTKDANGEKKYISCFLIDSRADEEIMQDIIRNGVHQFLSQKNSQQAQQPQQLVMPNIHLHRPAGPTSMSEVNENEQVPF